MMGGLVLVGVLWLGLQPEVAERSSLSSIDAKLDKYLPLLPTIDASVDLVLQKLDRCIELVITRAPVIFPGDGYAGHGPSLRYQDNGDGTITDLNTRLMWEKKTADETEGPCLTPGEPFLIPEHGVHRK